MGGGGLLQRSRPSSLSLSLKKRDTQGRNLLVGDEAEVDIPPACHEVAEDRPEFNRHQVEVD